jgi:hypothetical protein
MEIRIVLNETEPPSGHLERLEDDDGRATTAAAPFTGWLGLLRALSTVVGHPYPPSER